MPRKENPLSRSGSCLQELREGYSYVSKSKQNQSQQLPNSDAKRWAVSCHTGVNGQGHATMHVQAYTLIYSPCALLQHPKFCAMSPPLLQGTKQLGNMPHAPKTSQKVPTAALHNSSSLILSKLLRLQFT